MEVGPGGAGGCVMHCLLHPALFVLIDLPIENFILFYKVILGKNV
jgi:hypothetical protein